MEEVIRQNKGTFMADNWDIGYTTQVKHYIKTTGEPINIKPWRQRMHLEDKIEETIKNLFKNGIIRKCNWPWSTPMISVWTIRENLRTKNLEQQSSRVDIQTETMPGTMAKQRENFR